MVRRPVDKRADRTLDRIGCNCVFCIGRQLVLQNDHEDFIVVGGVGKPFGDVAEPIREEPGVFIAENGGASRQRVAQHDVPE